MGTTAKHVVQVIKRSERVRAPRGRKAVILPEVLADLGAVTFDGENGCIVAAFGTADVESGKRGAIAGKIKSHWKALHGEDAPKLEVDWLKDSNLPQVFTVQP